MRMSKMKWTTGVCVCSAVAMLMNLIGGRLPAAQAAAEGSVSPKVREAWERIGLSGGGTKKWPELLKPENSSITFSAATHLLPRTLNSRQCNGS